MALDLKRLKYFVEICDVGSLTGAANTANVSQPVLSYHITELERYFGDKLLYRHPHGIALSDAGKTLLTHARLVLQAAAQAEQAMQERSSQPSGSVSVGILSSIAPNIGPSLLNEARTRFPRIEVKLLDGDNIALRNQLHSGRLDMAVTLRDEGNTSSKLLMVEDMFLYGRREQWKTVKPSVSLREALQYPLVLPPQTHTVRRLVESTAKAEDLELKLAWEVEGLTLLKSVIMSAPAMGILGYAAIRAECESGQFVAARISKPAMQREIVLETSGPKPTTRASKEISAIVVQLVEALGAAARWRRLQPAS